MGTKIFLAVFLKENNLSKKFRTIDRNFFVFIDKIEYPARKFPVNHKNFN